MDAAVKQKAQELIKAMQDTEDYRNYVRLEQQLAEDPEMRDLRERINAYRLCLDRLQQSGEDVYDKVDAVEREYETLFRIPFVNAYLEAETAVCRMLQRVIQKMNDAVGVKVPR